MYLTFVLSNFILKRWQMGAVCVALVNEVMLAKTDATSLHNKLCCAAGCVIVFIANSTTFLMPVIGTGWCTSTWGHVTLLKGVQQYPLLVVSVKKRKLLLVLHTNVLLLLISLELLCGPIYLHYTLSTMAGFKEHLPLNFEAPFCSFWDVNEVVDSQQSLSFI